jgi:hypothetical protein
LLWLKQAGVVDSVTLTGGCAKNEGLKQAIEKVLKAKGGRTGQWIHSLRVHMAQQSMQDRREDLSSA